MEGRAALAQFCSVLEGMKDVVLRSLLIPMKCIQHLLMFCQVSAKGMDRGLSSEEFNLQVVRSPDVR